MRYKQISPWVLLGDAPSLIQQHSSLPESEAREDIVAALRAGALEYRAFINRPAAPPPLDWVQLNPDSLNMHLLEPDRIWWEGSSISLLSGESYSTHGLEGGFIDRLSISRVEVSRDDLSTIVHLLAEVAGNQSGRGRKPHAETEGPQIVKWFLEMNAKGKVSFKRGGLSAVAKNLHKEFPNYRQDSIRKMISGEYAQAKARTETG